MQIKVWVATKAFIVYKKRILILREAGQYKDGSNIGKYDIVGGRLGPGQRFDQSLMRKIKEESGLKVSIGRPFYVGEWRQVVRGEQWQIVGIFFECIAESDKVKLSKDYEDYKWINPKDYRNYPLIENLIPAFEAFLAIH